MELKKITCYGNVLPGGKLILQDEHILKEFLSGITGKVRLIFQRIKRQRTTDQNAYYWWAIHQLAEHIGDDPLDVHEEMKIRFNPAIVHGITIGRSTTKLSTKEFAAYTENVRQFAQSFFNFYIPPPSTVQPKNEPTYEHLTSTPV